MPAETSRRTFLAGALGTAALGLAGCGGVGYTGGTGSRDGRSGTLTIQGFGAPDDVGTARINAFRHAYPGVDLKINEGAFDPQQFLSSVAGGDSPDLVYMDRTLVGTYAAKGAVLPLDDRLHSAGVDVSAYRSTAIAELTFDGSLYGVPEFYDTRNILVNLPVFAEAGIALSDFGTSDWNRLHSHARALYSGSGGRVTRIGFDPKLPEFLPLWARANGSRLVNPDGSPNLDDPLLLEATDYAVSLIDEQGGWSAFKAFRDTWDLFGKDNQFAKKQAGAFPWEGWYVNVLAEASPDLKLACVPFTDRKGAAESFESGSAWCLVSGAVNPRAAINWMVTMTSQQTWLAAAAARERTSVHNKTVFTGLWTARAETDHLIEQRYAKPGASGYAGAVRAYYASTEHSFPVAASRAGSEILTAWQDGVNRVLSGESSVRSSMLRAQDEAAKAFQAER